MATAFRSDAEVTNGTAGTSVTVSKPVGIVDTGANPDRDHLIAFIAATGIPTFTAPADWTLITTAVDAANAVTLKAYRKLASSEGASWTWTLGSAQRNWGWVGAYTGVDPDDPVLDFGTDLTLDTGTTLSLEDIASLPIAGQGVSAAAATRTASGVATTWTHSSTERADLSTNAGAGTDIAGAVGDSVHPGGATALSYGPSVVASQSQTAGVLLALTLNPYFVPYEGGIGDAGLILEAAFGVDPDSDSSEWTWTDLSTLGLVLRESRVVLEHGRSNRSSLADPSRMAFTLKNLNGEFTHPTGAYTQYMVRNLPFRVRLNGFGVDAGGDGYHRGTAFLASMRPRWDPSTNFSVVDVVAQGRLRRLQQRTDVLHSAGYRSVIGVGGGIFALGFDRFVPVAYWPFEDESEAVSAASAIPGVADLAVSGVTFAADSSATGSAPLATLATGASIIASAPGGTDTGFWSGLWVMSVPTIPAATTTVMTLTTTGTALTWQIELVPGGTDQWAVRAYDSSGTSLLNQAIGVVAAEPYLFSLSARQDGADIDYTFWYLRGAASGGGFGVTGTVSGRTTGHLVAMVPQVTAALDGAVFGHLAMYDDPDYLEGDDPQTAASAIFDADPAQNELPSARFSRICSEEGIPNVADTPTYNDLFMGPQPVATLMSLLRESETVDNTVLNDSGESGTQTGMLWLPARDARQNIDASLTLASGEMAQPFEPVLDDQDIVNDVEVSRTGGSSARATDETSIAVEGRYRELVQVNTADDTFLQDLASWRVNLGVTRGMRFPAVGWNLRRTPTLAEQWMACRLFHRIDVAAPPSQYPPDTIETILEGYREVLAQDEWTVQGYLSPYEPNKVGVLAEANDTSEYAQRLAGDPDAAIRVAIDDNDTSVQFDPNRHRWDTDSAHFTPNLRVRLGRAGGDPGELVTVSSIATTAVTLVAAGAASHADNAAVTPAMFAGATTRDGIFVLGAIRSSGTGTLSITTGYERLPVFAATDNVQLWFKVHDGSESDPVVTPSGGSVGDTVSAFTFGFRGTPSTLADPADVVVLSHALLNASAQNIAYHGIFPFNVAGCVLLLIGWKQDDYTSVAVPATFTEILEASTTTGSDQSLYLAYRILTTPAGVSQGSLAVTGGAAAISRSAIVAVAAGYQTMTVSARSVNGVVKAHAAGAKVAVDNPFRIGLF